MRILDTILVLGFFAIILFSGWLGWTYNDGHSPYLTSFFSMLGFSMIYMLLMQHLADFIRSITMMKN